MSASSRIGKTWQLVGDGIGSMFKAVLAGRHDMLKKWMQRKSHAISIRKSMMKQDI